MENAVKRQVERKGIGIMDVLLVGVLLAAGAVLRLVTPPVFGITPNLLIVMYCLAIYLIKPRYKELIFISLVAAALCHLTTKSMIPYINFISEPIGATVAFLLVKAPFKLQIKTFSLKPGLVTLFSTLASGLVYVSVLKFLILFVKTPKNPAYIGLLSTVIAMAVLNTIIAQVIYKPVQMAAGKQE